MKALFITNLYPPDWCAGARLSMHAVAKKLHDAGHAVRVYAADMNEDYTYQGVQVFSRHAAAAHDDTLETWPNIIFTQLSMSAAAIRIARGRPTFHMVCDDEPDRAIEKSDRLTNAIIYNSNWLRAKLSYPHASFTLHPPCDISGEPSKRRYITLINLCDHKGGKLFWALARKLPQHEFLGVRGAYGKQLISERDNVEIWPHDPDIRKVYDQTRILIMPSSYESWGRTAREAMKMSIPVICTDTRGLRENCGDAAIYCDKRKPQQWIRAIKSLADPANYERQVWFVQDRISATKDIDHELDMLVRFVENFAWRQSPGL